MNRLFVSNRKTGEKHWLEGVIVNGSVVRWHDGTTWDREDCIFPDWRKINAEYERGEL